MPWKKGHSPLSAAPRTTRTTSATSGSTATFDAVLEAARHLCRRGTTTGSGTAPMMFMSSWYDPYPRTATDNYIGLSRRKKGPVRLILGPWTHGDRSLTYAGDVDFGPAGDDRRQSRAGLPDPAAALVRRLAEGRAQRRPGGARGAALRHGRRHGAAATPRGAWTTAAAGAPRSDWPIPDARLTAFHLHGDGRLIARAAGRGRRAARATTSIPTTPFRASAGPSPRASR